MKSNQEYRLMLAAIYTVHAFDPYLIPDGDWERVKNYFLAQIEAETDRISSYGEIDNRQEMPVETRLVFGTIMKRWLSCGASSGPGYIRGICKEFGLKGF